MLIKFLEKLLKITTVNFQSAKSIGTAIKTSSHIESPTVTIKQGKLKGAVKKLLDGTPYYSFKGIPYAQAPTGELRFTGPLPPQPWQGTYEAIKHGPVCPQYDMITRELVEGNENCLYLNVYSKSLNTDSKLPVMVFIHGGAYMSGSGDTTAGLGPEFLLPHDIILVTINYRLGVLGFLNLDIPEIPGNAGMKDQVFALRWIQNNIAQFGGDPDNVTLFGESAGGSSVTFHMVSPMSKGLFHKAIAQSGVAIADWAQGKNGKQRAFMLANGLGKDTKDVKEVLEFLRSIVPAVRFAKSPLQTLTLDEKNRGLPIHFAPVVEKKFENVEPFLTEEAIDSLLAKNVNDVPMIVGYNSDEGIPIVPGQFNKLEGYNNNPEYLVPREIALKVPEQKMKEFGERIKKFYIGAKDFTVDDVEIIAKLMNDLHFSYSAHRFCHLYSDIQPTYLYRFSCDTDLNIAKKVSGYGHMKGAVHLDDLFYIFCSPMTKELYNTQPELREIVYRVTKLWTDFAKTGNPTPDSSIGVQWPPYSRTTRTYLEIGDTFTVARDADRDRVYFWNKLYSEAGLPCITKSTL